MQIAHQANKEALYWTAQLRRFDYIRILGVRSASDCRSLSRKRRKRLLFGGDSALIRISLRAALALPAAV